MQQLIAENGPLAQRILQRETKKQIGKTGNYGSVYPSPSSDNFTSYLISQFPKWAPILYALIINGSYN